MNLAWLPDAITIEFDVDVDVSVGIDTDELDVLADAVDAHIRHKFEQHRDREGDADADLPDRFVG